MITKNPTNSRSSAKKAGFSAISSLFDRFQIDDKGGYITQEFQDFGYRLACELNDQKHKSLYIKMAKEVERGILERALSFVADADSAKSKARLFMWKVNQLRTEKAALEKKRAAAKENS
jgi:hypothetical protein